MRYSLKFFTQGMTFLGVSSLLIFSTLRTAAISPTQQQQLFPQRSSQPQIFPSPYPSKIQPFLEIKRLVQETESQSSGNPFVVRTNTPRRGGKTVESLLAGSTFYSRLELAQLQDILNPENQNLVIFAPTNEAWATLGEQGNQLRRQKNREQLRQLLQNHIVQGQGNGGLSEEQFQQGSVQALGGKTIQIQPINNNETEVNGIRVSRDEDIIQAIDQNSIIVEIDRFLFEPEL